MREEQRQLPQPVRILQQALDDASEGLDLVPLQHKQFLELRADRDLDRFGAAAIDIAARECSAPGASKDDVELRILPTGPFEPGNAGDEVHVDWPDVGSLQFLILQDFHLRH